MHRHNIIYTLKNFSQQNHNLIFRNISIFLIDNIDKIKTIKLKEVANFANCSQSSIVNFVKKNKFNSFKEMLFEIDNSYKFISFINKENDEPNLDSILINYKNLIQENIDFAFEKNKLNILKLVHLLKEKKSIYLIGKGSNLDVLRIFSKYLSKKGINCYYSSDFDVQEKWVDFFQKDDITIFFTFSGNSPSIISIFEQAKNKQSKIITFTANHKSMISYSSDIVFLIKENEDILLDHTNARISFIYLIMNIINLL